MFQLSWKLMGMILTIFWTSLRYLGIDSRALRGTIGRLFSFLWLYNQPFYMPPNFPRALRKGAVSSFFVFFYCFPLFKTTEICFGSTKMGIFYREKAFHTGKKWGMTLPPLKNIPLTPLHPGVAWNPGYASGFSCWMQCPARQNY